MGHNILYREIGKPIYHNIVEIVKCVLRGTRKLFIYLKEDIFTLDYWKKIEYIHKSKDDFSAYIVKDFKESITE